MIFELSLGPVGAAARAGRKFLRVGPSLDDGGSVDALAEEECAVGGSIAGSVAFHCVALGRSFVVLAQLAVLVEFAVGVLLPDLLASLLDLPSECVVVQAGDSGQIRLARIRKNIEIASGAGFLGFLVALYHAQVGVIIAHNAVAGVLLFVPDALVDVAINCWIGAFASFLVAMELAAFSAGGGWGRFVCGFTLCDRIIFGNGFIAGAKVRDGQPVLPQDERLGTAVVSIFASELIFVLGPPADLFKHWDARASRVFVVVGKAFLLCLVQSASFSLVVVVPTITKCLLMDDGSERVVGVA